jgi:flavin reductase (DIM6/NTAB) family NADH-FMN oxidoreductase RutF
MFYRPADGHPLKHNPFKAVVTPRPIGWISSRADGRDNLAPYSFFNAVSDSPPQVMFASTSAKQDRGDTKDSIGNIRTSGVFCVNIVEYAMRDRMNLTSGGYDKDTDEFDLAGIEKAECETIDCPRVANAPASLECRLTRIVKLEGEHNFMALGEVTGVHLRDNLIEDGLFHVLKFEPLTRLGYRDYSRITEVFSLNRPGE